MSEPRDIVFVIERRLERAGSVHMRGRQLARLFADVAADYGQVVRQAYADEALRGVVAIVNKSALMRPNVGVAARLRDAGCTVLVDYVDGRIDQPSGDAAHGFIACSALQYRHLRSHWPNKPCIHLPHHADLDIGDVACQWDSFRCAYFGHPDNALHLQPLAEAGLVTPVVTQRENLSGWMDRLPEFNLHYAFRPRALWGRGFKPFTKGFTAARAGAVVLVADCDEEATELLGADYPFRLPGTADAALVAARLETMRDGFGGADWALARSRMGRLREVSSAAYLRALIRANFFEEGGLSAMLR